MNTAKPRIASAALMAVVLIANGARAQQTAAKPALDRPPSEGGVERFRLANDLSVILRPIKGAKTTAMVVLYAFGEEHDPPGRSGLGHTIEHLYITAATGDAKARSAEEDLRKQYPDGTNAQTGDRYTVIATIFPPERLGHELADASARMGDLKVTAEDLDRERPRLLQEVSNMFENFPALAAMNNARERAYPRPAGGRHGGRPEVLQSITLGEVRARLARYYKPRNATLALAGRFDPVAARKAIVAHFSALPSGEPIPPPSEPGTPSYLLPVGERPGEAGGTPIACLAYRAPRPDSELYAPFLVLVMRLSIRAKLLGDAGPIGSPIYFPPLDDGSVVAISSALKPGETPAAAFARIEDFVGKAVAEKLGTLEAAQTKRGLGMILGLVAMPDAMMAQNPYFVAFGLARREQLGLDGARLGKALDALTDADRKKAAEAIFAPGRHAGAIAGGRP